MITFSKIKSSSIESGKRILKVLQFGAKTANECAPFGFDSNAPEGFTAIFADTSNVEESVVLGYINKNQLAEIGSSRIFAVDDSGQVISFLHCRANGNIELNGAEYSSVRFENLKIATDNNNALINAELDKISLAISSLDGTYTPADISTNLTDSKSETVKIK